MRGETVTVTRLGTPDPNTPDEQGNPTVGASSTFDVDHVAVAPKGSDESAQTFGQQSVSGYTLYCPSGTILLSTDIIEIRGVPGWHVEGDAGAGQWTSPFSGRGKGVEFAVKRAS